MGEHPPTRANLSLPTRGDEGRGRSSERFRPARFPKVPKFRKLPSNTRSSFQNQAGRPRNIQVQENMSSFAHRRESLGHAREPLGPLAEPLGTSRELRGTPCRFFAKFLELLELSWNFSSSWSVQYGETVQTPESTHNNYGYYSYGPGRRSDTPTVRCPMEIARISPGFPHRSHSPTRRQGPSSPGAPSPPCSRRLG